MLKKILVAFGITLTSACAVNVTLTLRMISGEGGENGEPLDVIHIKQMTTDKRVEYILYSKLCFWHEYIKRGRAKECVDEDVKAEFGEKYRTFRTDEMPEIRAIEKSGKSSLVYKDKINEDAISELFNDIKSNPEQENFDLHRHESPEGAMDVCFFTQKQEIITTVFYKFYVYRKGIMCPYERRGGVFMDIERLQLRMNEGHIKTLANIRIDLPHQHRLYGPGLIQIEGSISDYDVVKANKDKITSQAGEEQRKDFEHHQNSYASKQWYKLYTHCLRSVTGKKAENCKIYENPEKWGLKSLLCAREFLKKHELPQCQIEIEFSEEVNKIKKIWMIACEDLKIRVAETYFSENQGYTRLNCSGFVAAIDYIVARLGTQEEIEQKLAEIAEEYPELG